MLNSFYPQREVQKLVSVCFLLILSSGCGDVEQPKQRRQDNNFCELINSYYSQRQSVPMFANVQKLKYWENMLENEPSDTIAISKEECKEDSVVGNSRKVTYIPQFIKDSLASEKYLNVIPRYGRLRNYKIAFYFKDTAIEKVIAVIDCKDKNGLETYAISNTDFDLGAFANKSKIKAKEKEAAEYKEMMKIEQQNEARQAQLKKLQENFEHTCLSAWDGSCRAVVNFVKDNMNNPSSFEHVETRYFIRQDYAIVVMKYRGTNAFGGIVTDYVKVKVGYNCEILGVMQE
jgi:uncharacterized lipoprotein YehR (DUF1307 family)